MFKPQSSVADYVGAALSGAVACSGIGFVGSIALNTAISTTTYAINCSNGDDEFSASGLLLAAGSGAVSGAIGGSGANLAKCEGIYDTSRIVLKRAVSSRKIALYTAKIATVKAKIIKSAICTALAPSGASVAKHLIHALF